MYLYFIFFILTSCATKEKVILNESNETIYHNENKSLSYNAYSQSQKFYWDYLNNCKKNICTTKKKLFAIDVLGSIYIRYRKDPDALIIDFEKFRTGFEFNDAIEDELTDWISAANDWLSTIKTAQSNLSSTELINIGNLYFEKGIKLKDFPMDRKGNPYLSIASSYYLPFIYQYDNSNELPTILYRMGIIQSLLWYDPAYWSQNHYLKEIIRRFPDKELAKKALIALESEIHASYTGSSGDNTPESQIELIEYFKDLLNKKENLQKALY